VSGAGLLLVGLAMVVGVAGTVVPGLPGLPVIWVAGLVWALNSGGTARWVVLAVLTALLAAGTAAQYVLPARRLGGRVPRSTMLLGAAGAVVGFFVIPLVGLVVGGVAGVYAAEAARTRDHAAAWDATKRVLAGFGLAMAVEVGAGLAMVATWLAGVALS
jgi:uncharacterized protein YqgC (DUF456 family)